MNPRQQGDLGEMSALEWFASQGASVYYPIGHSPDVDLVVWLDGRYVGVQVKTSGARHKDRYSVSVCTRGGNQSWNKIVKRFSASRCDLLFVLVSDGRRWVIPADAVEGTTAIMLGGPKYAEYEVARGRPFPALEAA